ncbi:hypothetical protein DFH29DRAFT_877231 [Suillus ampliporus]|nr:hypothetical protein DFH29DRAFT_877231 [Suillus ampliporus]
MFHISKPNGVVFDEVHFGYCCLICDGLDVALRAWGLDKKTYYLPSPGKMLVIHDISVYCMPFNTPTIYMPDSSCIVLYLLVNIQLTLQPLDLDRYCHDAYYYWSLTVVEQSARWHALSSIMLLKYLNTHAAAARSLVFNTITQGNTNLTLTPISHTGTPAKKSFEYNSLVCNVLCVKELEKHRASYNCAIQQLQESGGYKRHVGNLVYLLA